MSLLVLFAAGCGSNDAAQETSGAGTDATKSTLPVLTTATAPEVHANSTYDVEVSTHVYGQGQVHDEWGGDVQTTIDLVLDVYEPIDAPPGRPALVAIHGGGFTGGSRTTPRLEPTIDFFAERGWVVLSIDYRVAEHHGTIPEKWYDLISTMVPAKSQNQGFAMYPAARDAKAATRWLHANADDYQVDSDYITVLGGSAGSALAVMLGTSNPVDFTEEISLEDDPTLASTNLDANVAVQVIIDNWGSQGHLQLLEGIDGQSRYDDTDAPVLIVHGTDDPTVSIEEADKIAAAYDETGVPYAYYPIEGAGHGIWNTKIDGQSLPELNFDFIVEHLDLQVVS